MVHFQNTFVAYGAMMGSWWFWFDALLANTDSLGDQSSLWWITSRNVYSHVIVKADVD